MSTKQCEEAARLLHASDRKRWVREKLVSFAQLKDKVRYCLQSRLPEGQLEGDWYATDPNRLIIYFGAFGNGNGPPGLPDNTHAEVFQSKEAFEAELRSWRKTPDFL